MLILPTLFFSYYIIIFCVIRELSHTISILLASNRTKLFYEVFLKLNIYNALKIEVFIKNKLPVTYLILRCQLPTVITIYFFFYLEYIVCLVAAHS